MSKDIELRIQIDYGDITVERQISSKTSIRVEGNALVELSEEHVVQLYKALTAYARADGIEL